MGLESTHNPFLATLAAASKATSMTSSGIYSGTTTPALRHQLTIDLMLIAEY
jgi:hypothetical protein